MTNFTVASLSDTRNELKGIITAVLPQFPNIDRVHFRLPGMAGGLFEPTQFLVLKAIPQFSFTMGEVPEAKQEMVTIQVGLETTPIQPQMAMTNQLTYHNPANPQNNFISNAIPPRLVELFSFTVNTQANDEETIDRVIDAIFIPLIVQFCGQRLMDLLTNGIKGLEYEVTPLGATVVVKKDEQIVHQYSTGVHGSHFHNAMTQAIATALVLIPENHNIVFHHPNQQRPTMFANNLL